MSREPRLVKLVREAAEAHTDLTMFYAVISLLEGGHLYCSSSQADAQRIIGICKRAAGRRLHEYDRAVAKITAQEAK